MKGENPMKKLISLVLVLALSLTAVSAFAEILSPTGADAFAVSGDDATTTTEGVTIGQVTEASKSLVEDLVKSGDLAANLFAKTTFVDAKNGEAAPAIDFTKTVNVAIIPMPTITIDSDALAAQEAAAAENAAEGEEPEAPVTEIETPIPETVGTYLVQNDAVAVYTYQDGDSFVSCVVEYIVMLTKDGLAIRYSIPSKVLAAANGAPAFMDFEVDASKVK